MSLKYYLQLIIWSLWLMEPSVAANPSLAKPDCRDTCGNVSIPYPFGIGRAECFLNKWFEIVCPNNSRPYLKKYSEYQEFGGEVLGVSLDYGNITIINAKNSKLQVCENHKPIQLAMNLSGSPFYYQSSNEVIFVGCGSVKVTWSQTIDQTIGQTIGNLTRNSSSAVGCTPTSCDHQNNKFNGTCDGVNCCEFSLGSSGAQYLNLSLSHNNNLVSSTNNSCGDVSFRRYQNNSYPSEEDLLGVPKPIDLTWGVEERMDPELDLQNNPNCYAWTYGGAYRCFCPTYIGGNPYLPNGCQGRSKSRKKLIMLVVGGTSFGILFLVTACFLLYKMIRKRIERKLKQKFFTRNGGLLLQQQLSVDKNLVDKVRFLTSSELEKATDNFNKGRVLGQGGQGTVYKGMLADGKIVAIKKSELIDENQVEDFINEVVVLSQVIHRNVVKLLGCCLETSVPLLVYEFISNGTLYELLHSKNDEFIMMSWNMRLRIATEISGALAYLHTSTSVPIYHRDIKSSNILLDEKHTAKVSDFGISKSAIIDQTHVTTMVKGTFGYLDPEYFHSHQFTEKSDVYSFGVVLIELLTRQKPISSIRSTTESGLSLATRFLISMEKDQLNMILDTQIMDVSSYEQVRAVAILAQRCLNLKGKKRPTMKEVASELENIKMSHLPSTAQRNFEEPKDAEIELAIFPDAISSVTTASEESSNFEEPKDAEIELAIFPDAISSLTTPNEESTSSSDVYPLLSNTF